MYDNSEREKAIYSTYVREKEFGKVLRKTYFRFLKEAFKFYNLFYFPKNP
jgi:hypothetical protein